MLNGGAAVLRADSLCVGAQVSGPNFPKFSTRLPSSVRARAEVVALFVSELTTWRCGRFPLGFPSPSSDWASGPCGGQQQRQVGWCGARRVGRRLIGAERPRSRVCAGYRRLCLRASAENNGASQVGWVDGAAGWCARLALPATAGLPLCLPFQRRSKMPLLATR